MGILRFSSQRPPVKSGIATGAEPIAMDCSLRQVMLIHAAASYTSMGGWQPFCTLSTKERSAR